MEKGLSDVLSECTVDGLYACENCSKKMQAKVRHELVRLPKILIFHIKRFDSQFRKIRQHCKYSATIDIDQ
jgi:ubiquitin C-terminal hydrolase